MKKTLFLLLFSLFTLNLFASHIVGGEVAYTYAGPGSQPNTSKYNILLRLFTECGQVCGGGSGVACPPTSPIIGIFVNTPPYTRVTEIALTLVENPQLNLTTYPPCLDNQPTVCYQVNTYSTQVELVNTAVGYRLSYQSCCRAASINVIPDAASATQVPGATYEAVLPGTNTLATGHNSTAIVNLKDTALICHNSPFTLEFSAVDPDNDSLSYAFVAAYNGGSFTASNDTQGPDLPIYGSVNYEPGYSGALPLGPTVSINNLTGVISGIAPSTVGKYVVNVIIREWRGGVLIAEHRKDFLVRTNECTLTRAQLGIIPVSCDGFTVDFSQFNNSSGNITDYLWDFGDPASGPFNTSTLPGPTHTFSDTGVYKVKLRVSSAGICVDSTTQTIRVYPGFIPDFTSAGKCSGFPIQFTDMTAVTYGSANSWQWNFGEVGSASNTSILKNPTHIYTAPNTYDVTLIVSSNKGCLDTVVKTINILASPPLQVSRDTLICTVDTLQLNAIGTGTFLWTPNYMISNVNIASPLVSPDVTTTYHVTLTDAFGCFGKDSVKVRVVNAVTQFGNYDTTICQTDPIILRLSSDALYFNWTPNTGLNSNTVQNPIATPLSTTTYHVVGSISAKCFAQNDITVKVVPYPVPNAGPDIAVCFGNSTQLHASGGSIYAWTPTIFLNNSHIANPQVVNPTSGVKYIVSVRDTLGCPKAVRDTVLVNVIRIIADAGPSDTSVVLGQPLQLGATGGSIYLWTPATWLNDPNIPNPISLPQNNIKYTVKVSDANGCFGTDTILVHTYYVKPDIYVPSGFSPNGDGNNDIFRPILIGMRSLDEFKVYNRWGQMLYSGSGTRAGWDGTYGGRPQDPATFVWYAVGTDYLNKVVKRKGYVVLIR